MSTGYSRFKSTLAKHGGILAILLIALAIRITVIAKYGLSLNLHSDDAGYTRSAIWLLSHHVYAFYAPNYPTLHMMPGIVVMLAGVFSVFGTGGAGIIAAKVLMTFIGVASIWGVYLVGKQLWSRGVGLWAAALAAVYVPGIEVDTLQMTETPSFLSNTFTFYYIVRAANERKGRYIVFAAIFYVIGVYFRPTNLLWPVVAALYLFVRRYPLIKLVKSVLVSLVLVAVCLSPWWIRNEHTFHHFIPLTDDTSNPLLLGTFQGPGYPGVGPYQADPYIQKLLDQHPELQPTSEHELEWMYVQKSAAKQRIQYWIKNSPQTFIHTYVVLKPKVLWNKAFYLLQILHVKRSFLDALQPVLVVGGLLGYLVALLFGRKRRWEVLFMLATFGYYTSLYSYYYVYSRYNEPLMPFMMMGIPFGIAVLWRRIRGRRAEGAS